MRSSLLAIGSVAEGEDLTTGGDRMEIVRTPADPDEFIPIQTILISSEMSIPEPSPRPTRELRPRTKIVAKAAKIFEPSDPTHISIDDDSDTT